MTDFQGDLTNFSATLQARVQAVFANIASAAKLSITDGSPLTGAPGQPVQSGVLKASWELVFDSPTHATIGTNLVYAPPNEYGINNGRPYNQRSSTGGRHSLAMTVAGFQNLVNAALQEAGGDSGGPGVFIPSGGDVA